MSLDNPWTHLPTRAPFVLREDREAIESFNRRTRLETQIETALLPVPFVGRIDAPVILLLLKPGSERRILHLASHRRDIAGPVRACHRQDSVECPELLP